MYMVFDGIHVLYPRLLSLKMQVDQKPFVTMYVLDANGKLERQVMLPSFRKVTIMIPLIAQAVYSG